MRFTQPFVALVVSGLASAQLPDIPSCSANCFIDALTSDGCSSLTDFACHCQKPELVDTVTPCVRDACSVPEQSSVSSIVVSQCSAAGHPISVPPVNGASPTSLTGRSEASSSVSAGPTSSAEDSASSSFGASSSLGATPSSSSGVLSSSGSVPSFSASASNPVFTGAASNMKSNFAGAAVVAAAAACAM